MNIEDLPNIKLIENYLQGNLTEDERKQIEKRLVEAPDFKKEFDLIKDMLRSVELRGEIELKAGIDKAYHELKAEGFFEAPPTKRIEIQPSKKNKMIWSLWRMVAAVFVIGLFALFFLLKPSNPYAKLYADHFQPENKQLGLILDDLSASGLFTPDRGRRDSLSAALQLYQTRDYLSAKNALTSFLAAYSDDPVADFYLGLIELQLSNVGDALPQLRRVAENQYPTLPEYYDDKSIYDLQNQSYWYQALAYSRLQDQKAYDSVKILLNLLTKEDFGDYKVKADSILNSLE